MPTSRRRVGRWVLIGLGVVVGLAVLARVGVAAYLRTDAGRALVARQLSDALGLPVEVAHVGLGSRTSTLKFRVLDPNATPGQNEILSVESAEADVTLLDVLTRRVHPKELHLRGVTVSLALAADGKPKTTMPDPKGGDGGGPMPTIVLEGAQVHVRQEGRPEFALSGVDLKVEPKGDALALSGEANDPGWGKWALGGEATPKTQTGWVDLSTADGSLAYERLRTIPGLNPAIWAHLRPEGRGAAKVRLGVEANDRFVYDVTIQPTTADLGFPEADATLTGMTGTIRIHEGKVDIAGCKGRFAGGPVTVDGTWAYDPEPEVAEFRVTADELAVSALPAKWNVQRLEAQLPPFLKKDFDKGTLRGDARVKLVMHKDGRIEPYGHGEGVLVLPSFAGGSADVTVELQGNGKTLEFNKSNKPAPKGAGESKTSLRGGASDLTPQPPSLRGKGEQEGESSRHAGSPPLSLPSPPRGGVASDDPVHRALTRLVLLSTALQQPPAKASDNTVSATINLRDIDIGQLLEKMEAKIPYRIAGRVTVSLAISVPLESAGSSAAYKFTGTLSSPELRFEGLTVRELSAHVAFQDGVLTLTALKGRIPQAAGEEGAFTGTASAAVSPPGDIAADLTLTNIPLAEVARGIPNFTTELRGTVAGKASFRAPYEKIADPAAWTASAELAAAEVVAAGRTLKDVRFAVTVEKGIATLTAARVTVENIPVTADATLALTGKYAYTAAVRTKPLAVSDIRKLVPEADLAVPVEGLIETEAKASGTLSPFTVAGGGTLRATKLTLGKTTANHLSLKWALTTDRLSVTDLDAEVFGGHLGGSADLPLGPDKDGKFAVEFKDLDAAAALALLRDFPVRITGKVSGKMSGAIPPAKPGEPRIAAADVHITAPKLTVQGIPAEKLEGKFGLDRGQFSYALTGHTLGGTFEVKGKYPGNKKADAGRPGDVALVQPPDRGSLRVTGADLSRLGTDAGLKPLTPLGGTVDITLNYANDLSEGNGRVFIRGLSWAGKVYSQEVLGTLVMRDGYLELLDLGGTLAGGFFRGRGRVNLKDPDRNFFLVTLDRADSKRLFASVPDLAKSATGLVSLRAHGRFGAAVRVSGTVTLAQGAVGGVGVHELRIPFDLSSSQSGYGRLVIHDIGGQAGAGTIQGHLTYTWGGMSRLDGDFRFAALRLRSVVPSLGESSFFGGGRINGRVVVTGSNVRSLDDVQATLVASLTSTSVKELPVFQLITPYLNPMGMVKPFETGDIQGRLSGGVFRINRLALHSPNAQLFADGSVTTKGRLDLNVVAHTGNIGPESPGLRLLALRVPIAGPVPLTLIRDVSDFLSSRTVRLTVAGTVDAPAVQVNTAALLSEEAVRFFVSRYVLPAGLAGPLGFGSVTGGVLGTSNNK